MKKLILAVMLSVLLLGFGSSMAATSSIDNLPGGAGFNYFHASAAGDLTLFNIQNIDVTPILVHILILDDHSNHIVNFNIPLSAWDNWGCSITGDGTNITISPQTPCFYVGAGNGCFPPLVVALPADANGMQKGYMSFVISAGDSGWYGGNGDGDPRNDPIITFTSTRNLDVIAARFALLAPDNAIAGNSTHLQGFVNVFDLILGFGIWEITAGPDGGWDSIADVGVPFYWNCDLDLLDSFPTHDDPVQGLNIDSWEIMLTNFATRSIITDDFNADGIGETIYQAVGSPTWHIGRYNEVPGLSETILITVFPANNTDPLLLPLPFSPACGYSSTNITAFCYDDNEFPISTTVPSDEVGTIPFGPGASELHVPGTSGECRIGVDAPLLGFSWTEAGTFADLYPLFKVDQWINAGDYFNWISGHLLDPVTTEIIEIGIQETY